MCETNGNKSGDEFLRAVGLKAIARLPAYYNAHARVHDSSICQGQELRDLGGALGGDGGDRLSGSILARVIHPETDWPIVKGQI